MVRRKNRQSDSSVIVAVIVVAAIGAAIWVLHPTADAAISPNAAPVNTQTATQSLSNGSAQVAYAAWPVRSNATYGFSFSYPTDWAPSGDVTSDPSKSATRQEFGTGLKLGTATNSSNTIEVEVLDEPLVTAEAWYDQFYAQTPIKVNKSITSLKGKQSVQYDFAAPTYESKRYLFAVGTKTYMFSSVNESQNVSASATYWSDFNNTFDSLTIR